MRQYLPSTVQIGYFLKSSNLNIVSFSIYVLRLYEKLARAVELWKEKLIEYEANTQTSAKIVTFSVFPILKIHSLFPYL